MTEREVKAIFKKRIVKFKFNQITSQSIQILHKNFDTIKIALQDLESKFNFISKFLKNWDWISISISPYNSVLFKLLKKIQENLRVMYIDRNFKGIKVYLFSLICIFLNCSKIQVQFYFKIFTERFRWENVLLTIKQTNMFL